jgi:hypothetical protein
LPRFAARPGRCGFDLDPRRGLRHVSPLASPDLRFIAAVLIGTQLSVVSGLLGGPQQTQLGGSHVLPQRFRLREVRFIGQILQELCNPRRGRFDNFRPRLERFEPEQLIMVERPLTAGELEPRTHLIEFVTHR